MLTMLNSEYWNTVAGGVRAKPYLDPFLGQLKQQAYLMLLARWGGVRSVRRALKTDVFEEAMGNGDGFLQELVSGVSVGVGMDVSPVAARCARENLCCPRAHLLSADSRTLPFASSSFSLIVSPSTLDHFADPRDLGTSLRELARVLEPGGILIITLDNRQNIFDPLLRLAGRLGKVPYYLGKSYSVDELRGELEAAGFFVQETTAILHNPRLLAIGAVEMARRVGWSPLTRLVRHVLRSTQGLEHTALNYYLGSFVAAKAVRRG
jgi:SAM-dependent methyltransferase